MGRTRLALGGDLSTGGGAADVASAVAVLATASSNSARAVPVEAAAVSISGGIVAVPPISDGKAVAVFAGPVTVVVPDGEPIGEGAKVEDAAAVEVLFGVPPVLATVAGVMGVEDGPSVLVLDGVALGPGAVVDVRVAVLEGVRVAVRVAVRVGVRVDVFVGEGPVVLVAEPTGVSVTLGVADGGGGSTVNEPGPRVSGTAIPSGSLAAVLTSPRLNEPAVALGKTLNTTEAMPPLGIAVWLRPKMMTRTRSPEG